jgi:peptidoglycan/xylan/chitin deacetylase (PgdA/CDA1 family)
VVTVDLERDYHAPPGSFRGVTEAWPKLSDLFDRHAIRTHVFATSDLTVSHPEELRRIARGHELGCHGESHDVEYLSSKPYEWQLASIRRATEALERCTGVRPRAFRAPNFSANGDTIRALQELGYRCDSSVLPGRVVRKWGVLKLLDFLVAPRDPYRPSLEDPARPGDSFLWEIPVAENPLSLGGPIGLGYVHAYGVEKALEAVARSAADPCVILIHPWELLDPPPEGRGPAWMQRGCSSDPARLDEFLRRLRQEHEVATFDTLSLFNGSTSPAPLPG